MLPGQRALDLSPEGENQPDLYVLLRERATESANRASHLQRELLQVIREIEAINVLLESAGIEPVQVPELSIHQNQEVSQAANRFDVQIPPRKPQYQNMIYREAVTILLASGVEMSADELTRAIFEDCSTEAFKLAKNALIGAISTDVRSGLFERPRRSIFRLKRGAS